MGTSQNPQKPVESRRFSTAAVHGQTGLFTPFGSVFPVVHTPYDFYERI